MINTENIKVGSKFQEMIDLFNRMEKALEYPNCEGYMDKKRYLEYYEQKFNDLLRVN